MVAAAAWEEAAAMQGPRWSQVGGLRDVEAAATYMALTVAPVAWEVAGVVAVAAQVQGD